MPSIESNERKEQSNLLDELKKLWKNILSGLGLSEFLNKTGEKSESTTNISQEDNVENTENKAEQQLSESKENTCHPDVEEAINIAINIANDDKNGYIKGGKGEYNKSKGFDCCGLVCYSLKKAGFDIPFTSTEHLKDELEKKGFEWIPLPKNKEERIKWAIKNAKKGDIFLQPGKHVELYIGNGKIVGAHSNKDGKLGDSSGEEISVRDIKKSLAYRNPEGILRYKG